MALRNTVTAAASVIQETQVLGDATATKTAQTYRAVLAITFGDTSGSSTYQWQRSKDGSTFTSITGQTSQNYVLQNTIANIGNGWDTDYSHLRARVQYTVGGATYDFDSNAFDIDQPPVGDISITPTADGYEAITSGITAPNGIERFQYQWYFRANALVVAAIEIDGATDRIFTPTAANAAALPLLTRADLPRLSVSVSIFDHAGFSHTTNAKHIVQKAAPVLNIISPTPTAAVHLAAYTANVSGSTGTNTYQWQDGTGGSSIGGGDSSYARIDGATNPSFVLMSGTWDIVKTDLRVHAVHINQFRYAITADAVRISADATAALAILRPDILAVGSRIIASVTITDDNNSAQYPGSVTSYIWRTAQSDGSGTTLQQGANSVYVITDPTQASNLFVEVHYVDSLGYTGTIPAQQLPPPATRGNVRIDPIRHGQNPIDGSEYFALLTFAIGGNGPVRYQWQQTNGSGGNGTPINLAVGSSFTLSTTVGGVVGGNWNTNYSHLRLQVTHTDAQGVTILLSPEVEIARAANTQFNFLHASGYAVGDNITASVRVTDLNNSAANKNILHYTWKTAADDSGRNLSAGVDVSVFAITVRSELGNLFVSVRVMDELGYTTNIAQKLELDVNNPALVANITPPPQPIIGARFAANVQNRTPDIPAELSYQWRQTDSSGAGEDIRSATSNPFILRSTLGVDGADWNTDYTHLQLLVIHTNPIGQELTITTSPVPVAQPPIVNVQFSSPILPATAFTVSAGVQVTDNNNGDTTRPVFYTWRTTQNGRVMLEGLNMSVYEHNPQTGVIPTISAISLYLQVSVVDVLGFSAIQTASFISGDGASEEVQSGTQNAANILGILDVSNIDSALNLHLDSISDDGGGGGFLSINEVRLDQPTNLSRALLGNPQQPLAVNEFGGNYESKNNLWTAWASGNFSNLEGKPIANSGQRFEYEGDSFNFFGGVDRHISGDIRVGLAAGVNKTDLKVDFAPSAGSGKNDSVKRRMQLLFPYLHWQNDNIGSSLRFYAGAGKGEIKILEDNGCNATLDTTSSFVGISGNHVLLDLNEWAAEPQERFQMGGRNARRGNL